MEPRCQAPAQAVRGVTGAARQQMMMSASAMLQMYMLDLVCSTRLLCSDCIWSIIQCTLASPEDGQDNHNVSSDSNGHYEAVQKDKDVL